MHVSLCSCITVLCKIAYDILIYCIVTLLICKYYMWILLCVLRNKRVYRHLEEFLTFPHFFIGRVCFISLGSVVFLFVGSVLYLLRGYSSYLSFNGHKNLFTLLEVFVYDPLIDWT